MKLEYFTLEVLLIQFLLLQKGRCVILLLIMLIGA